MASLSPSAEAQIVSRFEQAQNRLVLQSADLSLDAITRMVLNEAIDVSPRYQRRERWSPEAESALIESFLLNVPVPPVYLAEDDFGTYSVIDGKQRITAIYKYLSGQFPLTALAEYDSIEGLRFEELPAALRNALSIRPYLRVVTLLKQTDPELKYEVFTRLNSGGQPLLPQEIRNALYRGPFNDLLFSLAESPFLRQQMKITTRKESAYSEMTDVEMVLRYFTLKGNWQAFSGDYRRSMDHFMATNRAPASNRLKAFERDFRSSLQRCEDLWGAVAFRRYTGNTPRDQFLAAVFDAQMIGVSTINSAEFERLIKHKVELIRQTKQLFADSAFEQAVRVSTNTATRVKYRIETTIALLKKIANR